MKEISFDAFYQLYQNDQLLQWTLREVDEFEALHLEGAQNLPLSQLADTYDQLDKDQLHYVICKSGMRSARACQFLSEQGYEVINVQGGMLAFEELQTLEFSPTWCGLGRGFYFQTILIFENLENIQYLLREAFFILLFMIYQVSIL